MNVIKINQLDSVAVATFALEQGESVVIDGVTITTKDNIPAGNKIALKDIAAGEPVIKYGYPIGIAKSTITAGEWVHSHNLKTGLSGTLEYSYVPQLNPPKEQKSDMFAGFRRDNGKVGIRNEIWIIPTVGCVNPIGDAIARRAGSLIHGSVDGVYSFPHPYGCSQLGTDHENTKKALCGLINHPNAGGVLVLGLGCENNTISGMQEMLGTTGNERIKFLVCQDHEDEIEQSLALIQQLIDYAAGFKREPVPTSELVIGLKCGGSDGLSGITANPLVGSLSDKLIAQGGTAILTEVPEMFGSEKILMSRCKSSEVFDKTVLLINNFKEYFENYNQPVYENPSPGNKMGGITTLEEKALGCTQKGGTATVTEVLSYGQSVCEKGLVLLNAPGNDLVASTALAISGAHIVLFTTGRGTPFGSPVPTVKISSNSALAQKKRNWIDFDAGSLVNGATMPEVTGDFYSYILKLAAGEIQTKTEQNGIREIAIFKDGVTL